MPQAAVGGLWRQRSWCMAPGRALIRPGMGQGSSPGYVVALADHGSDQPCILQSGECPFGRDVGDAMLLAERLDAR